MNIYTPPKPAPLPADFDEFYASLSPLEKELHLLAIEKLQSSYFVQWTHFYKKWKKDKELKATGT
jgi:hypothetical protein